MMGGIGNLIDFLVTGACPHGDRDLTKMTPQYCLMLRFIKLGTVTSLETYNEKLSMTNELLPMLDQRDVVKLLSF